MLIETNTLISFLVPLVLLDLKEILAQPKFMRIFLLSSLPAGPGFYVLAYDPSRIHFCSKSEIQFEVRLFFLYEYPAVPAPFVNQILLPIELAWPLS